MLILTKIDNKIMAYKTKSPIDHIEPRGDVSRIDDAPLFGGIMGATSSLLPPQSSNTLGGAKPLFNQGTTQAAQQIYGSQFDRQSSVSGAQPFPISNTPLVKMGEENPSGLPVFGQDRYGKQVITAPDFSQIGDVELPSIVDISLKGEDGEDGEDGEKDGEYGETKESKAKKAKQAAAHKKRIRDSGKWKTAGGTPIGEAPSPETISRILTGKV
tara:strand:+ start:289 stop:930 length:642 start_codon:yes stop_codon:yes gene_type:complete